MDGQTLRESPSNDELATRLHRVQQRLDCLETTLAAVTDEIEGLSLSSTCSKCEESLLIVKDGLLYCPNCGDGHSL